MSGEVVFSGNTTAMCPRVLAYLHRTKDELAFCMHTVDVPIEILLVSKTRAVAEGIRALAWTCVGSDVTADFD